ncbi:MAG: YebC/PmpR family DNA-binding transcriptional regulator [Candidatus Pacebacteria bacterium]|nr:YebC/PmpR family DNA-binding transcriptional regulator [Candidatus Paceibacterota bacterium]
MSGHSHAKNVARKKEGDNKKKGALFGKILKAITIAAKDEPNPDFNPRLRTAIEKARSANVPLDNIERALKKVKESGDNLEDIIIEAYGPEGSALLITAITDNKNRTISEIKTILTKLDAKPANPGSVLWAFEQNPETKIWSSKFPQSISQENIKKLKEIISSLENHDDVENVYTNINFD